MTFHTYANRLNSLLLNKVFASFVISVGILLVVGLASGFASKVNPFYQFFASADLGIRNVLLRNYAETEVHPAITVVMIDDSTLSDNG
ncbi:MAG: hypothetical protein QG650_200 [Patescibacteria group bacterium]|nr:hypothetical protein [Patescibacteria group bacterium]